MNNKPTVLAVDDSPIVQQLLKNALVDCCRLLVTGDAMSALSLLFQEPVAVLVLDVMMPDMDGLELCRTIRNLPQFKTLPIVMVTSKDAAFDKIQGRMAGATEYLTKPFEPEQLRQIISRVAGPLAEARVQERGCDAVLGA